MSKLIKYAKRLNLIVGTFLWLVFFYHAIFGIFLVNLFVAGGINLLIGLT